MKTFKAVLICASLLLPRLAAGEEPLKLEEVVVTGTREAEPLKEVPSTVNRVKEDEIKSVKPSHPSEVMNRVPGVWVNSTGGEGHITSIRQPLTTSPVYLFLEDGIPVRSTGFFNHNALYEMNMPGAGRVEVIKGTGTALYGSDAIGGTINVMTRPAPLTPEVEINPEAGAYDWQRVLATMGNTWGSEGVRLDLNATHSGGWRERKEYNRYSATLKWDHLFPGSSSAKTVLAYSQIDQQTSGGAPLTKADYDSRPWYNYHTFDFRNVKALRLSSAFEKEYGEETLLSVIPYMRWNRMDLMPEWGIFNIGGNNYRGSLSSTEFYSVGLLAKYRRDFAPLRTRLIFGADIDLSPGKYYERRTIVTRDTQTLKYTGFSFDPSTANNYDYDATFFGTSPYAQAEFSPVERLRVTVGARYDALSYDYTNNLTTSANRPESDKKSYYHLSPKAGAAYSVTDDISVFASYNDGFRIPSTTDLFKASGTATTAANLKPIKVDSYETGVRGRHGMVSFETALYYMVKKDDIVTFVAAPGNSQRLNAGKTEHKGVEVGFGIEPVKEVSLNASYSYSKHSYSEWKVSPAVDLSGREISVAPRQNLNVSLDYKPGFLNGGLFEIEWAHLGSYWMDDANTEKYKGHDLINLRASYKPVAGWELYAKALNIFDKSYADRVAKGSTGEALWAPGTPLTLFAGVVYNWRQ